jgi:hypothetical protein
MAHPGLTPIPPTIHHSSTPVTHRTAHTILSSFLSLAELDPSLRPDSVLTERGPTSSSSAANPNLTLAHLGRIKTGMEGKRSKTATGDADYDFLRQDGSRKRKFGSGDEKPRKEKDKNALDNSLQTIEDWRDAGEPALVSTSTAHGEEEEWQDREDYELAQDDDEVDVGNALRNAGTGGEDVEETVGTEGVDGEIVDGRTTDAKRREEEEEMAKKDEKGVVQKSVVDKAERKRLKREKSKKEKKTARPR